MSEPFHIGLHARRLKDRYAALERAFAEAWEQENANGQVLSWLLSVDQGAGHVRPSHASTERDRQIAATVIQWLGSNVGRDFLCNVLQTDAAAPWRAEFARRMGDKVSK